MSREHELKCWPSEFEALRSGAKTFEARDERDRDFAVDDVLVQQKYDPQERCYLSPSGGKTDAACFADTLRMRVTYILHGGRFGLPPGLCVMSIVPESEP